MAGQIDLLSISLGIELPIPFKTRGLVHVQNTQDRVCFAFDANAAGALLDSLGGILDLEQSPLWRKSGWIGIVLIPKHVCSPFVLACFPFGTGYVMRSWVLVVVVAMRWIFKRRKKKKKIVYYY